MNWKPADIAMVKALGGGSGGGGGGGVTPNIQATAETLPAGSEATVTRTGSNANPVFHFGIPEGEPGKTGQDGAPGAPGKDGAPGPAGQNGITPDIQVGTVTTLEPGQNATVTRQPSSPDSAPVFDFGIPKGQKGDAGGGSDLTAGDGLSKDGDTLNVDNPVQGIMTQAEFDALPEMQKTSGTYFVDDGSGEGGGGGQAQDIYSTEEQRIGTWIDGKPIYRLIIHGTFGSNGQWNEIADASYVDSLVDMRLSVDSQGYRKIGPDNVSACGITPNKKWAVYQSNYYTNAPVTLICEYTKTTDTATTAIASVPTTLEDSFSVDVVDDMMPPIMPITIGVADAGSIEEAKA